jgi:serine protease AprX
MTWTSFTRLLGLTLLTTASVLFATPAARAQANAGDMDPVVRQRSQQRSGRTRVIVQFRTDADPTVFSSSTSTGRRLGRGAQVAEVDNRDLAALASDPRVDRVVYDRPVYAALERTGLATGTAAARGEYGVTGRGVGIAVIDSGIAGSHRDLAGSRHSRRVVHFQDFTTPSSSTHADDEYGHGTHVAGILAGSGLESDGAHQGVAPSASLVGLKVLDADGRGHISDVIAAIDYAISLRSTFNIRVINLSVASGVFESYWLDPLTLAARRAIDAGIVVVASAGNLGLDASGNTQYGGITSPGNAPWVLTVGASSHQGTAKRSDDVVGSFSSSGPTWIDFAAKPDIVAPGVGIVSLADHRSTLYALFPELLVDGAKPSWSKPYISLSGTSMAAPVVAGTVALMLEANPSLTPNAVKAILQYTAQAASGVHPLTQGAGMLNTLGAIRLARFFASPAAGFGEPGDFIEGEWVPWAQHLVWGNYRVTGGVPLPGSSAWAVGTRWGALETTLGTPVVWGARFDDNIVWSTSSDENIVWSTDSADNIVWSTRGDDNIVWSTRGDENIVWSTVNEDNIVWSTSGDDNIVWSTDADDNIVWSTRGDENIVWSTSTVDNVVWGTDCGGLNCQRVIWGVDRNGTIWGTAFFDDNIVWSTRGDENIVWSTAGDAGDNIVWSTTADDNIVWSTSSDENIVWSTADNIVWSTAAIAQVLWADGP